MKEIHCNEIPRRLLLFICLFVYCCYSFSYDFKTSYEISCAGEGKTGYYLVEVSAFVTKKGDINNELTKKCAIHGVLFKGYAGGNDCVSKPAMIKDENIEKLHSDYFKTLLEEKYGYYTSMANDFVKVVKVGKQYKVTTIVQVNASQLRKDLERDKIIRSIGF